MRAISKIQRLGLGVALAVLVAGCSGADDEAADREAYAQVQVDPGGATSVDGGEAAEPQPTDPEAVLTAAAEQLFTWYPVSDANRGQATVRAADLLEPQLVNPTEKIRADAQWREWADNGMTITASATISPETHPPDTADRFSRVVVVNQVETSPSGERDLDPTVLFMTANRHSDGTWRVSEFAQK